VVDLDQGGAHAHSVIRSSIPADLADIVSDITVHEGGGAGWKIVADDAPHLVFSISRGRGESQASERCRLALVGARSRAVVGDHRARRLTAVLRFRPGGIPPVFGISGSELRDRSLDLHDLIDLRSNTGRFAALASRSPGSVVEGMVELVRSARRRRGSRGIDWRVRALLAAGQGAGQVSRAARRAGVSVRTLRRVVRRETGLSPKRLLRIQRLHRAFLIARSSGASWSRVAACAGYADQSHFTRDCRDLLGEPPATFLRRRTS
jgi:AraC-like DNA-binding protein